MNGHDALVEEVDYVLEKGKHLPLKEFTSL